MQLVFVVAVAFLLLGGAKAQQQQAQQDGGRCRQHTHQSHFGYWYGTLLYDL